ncbi:hypothetical protein EV401DRAFT_2088772 [Pisolithus croceorrhizus]|nr:hypothetical protein EV401DRAFT_2088772 [Pisolithus croceorrhizus]
MAIISSYHWFWTYRRSWSSLMQSLDKPINASSVTHFHSITLTIGCGLMAQLLRAPQVTADWWYKYGHKITPDAPTRRMANIDQMRHNKTYQRAILVFLLAMILTGTDPDHGLQCSKGDPAGYSVGFHATSVGQKQQEAMNHPEKKWKRLDNGKSAVDPAGASRALRRGKKFHATDGKPEEVEIGIVSASEGENPKTRGFWRVVTVAEVEHHLRACAEKD